MLAAFVEETKNMRLKYLSIAALLVSVAFPAFSLTQSEIKKCNAMAASFKAKKVEITEAKKVLDEKAAKTELAGEEWEAAEQMKLMSPQAAKEADVTKAAWEALKSEVYRDQVALQSKVQMLNKDVAAFNASCSPD